MDNALTAQQQCPKDFTWFDAWARQRAGSNASFLVVNPLAQKDCILRVDLRTAQAIPDQNWMLHPNRGDPSTFWPQYLKAQRDPSVASATRIAALTIFMASQLNPQGISGLELWQWKSDWAEISKDERSKLNKECTDLQKQIFTYLGDVPA